MVPKAHSTPRIMRSLGREAENMWIAAAEYTPNGRLADLAVRGGAVGGCFTV